MNMFYFVKLFSLYFVQNVKFKLNVEIYYIAYFWQLTIIV